MEPSSRLRISLPFSSWILWLALVSAACTTPEESPEPGDASPSEIGGNEPDEAGADTGELDCVGPNPSVVDNPGSYCTQNCTDVIHMLVCIDGAWRCPVPNPVFVRDCVWGERGDVSVRDFGLEDAGELVDRDGGAEPFD